MVLLFDCLGAQKTNRSCGVQLILFYKKSALRDLHNHASILNLKYHMVIKILIDHEIQPTETFLSLSCC